MKREIKFLPAWDKRHSDPHQNYGIHGVEIRFAVTNERGQVLWCIFTDWHLPHVREELKGSASLSCFPMPAELSLHSPAPLREGQSPDREACDLFGGPCYSEIATFMTDNLLELLIAEGGEALWQELEAFHRATWPSAQMKEAED